MFFEAHENALQIWLSQDIRIKVEYHKSDVVDQKGLVIWNKAVLW